MFLPAKWASHSALFLYINSIVSVARDFDDIWDQLDVVAEITRYPEMNIFQKAQN